MLNSHVECSIPTETKEFQNCNPFTYAECYGVSDIMNLFAETAVRLRAEVGVFTLAGESSGVGSCIDKLDKKLFKTISHTSFHISGAGAQRVSQYWPNVAVHAG